jgi:uncharacterized Zn-finger protein
MVDFEVIETDKKEIACDGGKGALGHPKVYLTFPKNSNEIVCPYCSRKFVLKKQ